jgi:DNA-binding LacI/PurR family transcriptional regulator
VADAAGVSRGTVSRVLNGGHWVSPEAEAKIKAAITATGYQPNQAARSLSSGRAGSVGFLLSEPQQLLFSDPNFAVLLREAARALAALDIPLLLMMAATQQERRRITRYIDAGHVDGVLLISPHQGDPLSRVLVERKVPAVCCGKPLGMEGRLSYVAADDFQGGVTMTTYLVQRGYQHIAMIAGPPDMSGGVERLAGYRSVCGQVDPRMIAYGDYSRESGAQAMTQLLAQNIPIDAVFAATDLMAAGAIEVIKERGLSVPDDIAVAGFDDAGLAAAHKPPLTTMHQPFDRIADEMVRLLLAVINGAGPAATLLTTNLIQRESA